MEFLDPEHSELGLEFNTDLVQESRNEANEKTFFYQQKIAVYFNKKFKQRHFL